MLAPCKHPLPMGLQVVSRSHGRKRLETESCALAKQAMGLMR